MQVESFVWYGDVGVVGRRRLRMAFVADEVWVFDADPAVFKYCSYH